LPVQKRRHATVFKNPTSSSFQILLLLFWSSKNFNHKFNLFNSSNSSMSSSSSSSFLSSGLARAKKLFCLLIRRERTRKREREREREREKVGKLVEQRFKTRAAKTTKLELGILSFCLLTIISSSLSNP